MELDNAIATPLYKQLEKLILDEITNGTLARYRILSFWLLLAHL